MKKALTYLTNLIPKSHQSFRARAKGIPTFYFQTECFKISFFPSALSNWFKLDVTIRNYELIAIFKSRLLTFIRPIQSNVYNISDPIELKFLTCLCLGFSHINEHRFRHNFQDRLNPLCSRSLETDDTKHYLLHCHHFSQHQINLINKMKYIFEDFASLSDNAKKDLLLFGKPHFEINKNKFILQATLFYIKSTERFSGSLFQ